MLACVLVVLGVFCKRIWLLFTAFITPNVQGAPGISLGTQHAALSGGRDVWGLVGTYAPTFVEIAIVAGVIALVAAAYIVLVNRFVR